MASPAQGLDYSWSYLTGQSLWILYRNGSETRAVGQCSQNKHRAGHRAWMFQTRMEFQGSTGPSTPQNTGNCPTCVCRDRRTSFFFLQTHPASASSISLNYLSSPVLLLENNMAGSSGEFRDIGNVPGTAPGAWVSVLSRSHSPRDSFPKKEH